MEEKSVDSNWAYIHRKRIQWVLGTVGFIVFFIYITAQLYTPPSCFDHERNQGEVGVDCGGPCEYYCKSQVEDTAVLWVSAFEVSPGWWSALAYIENPNFDKYADGTPYRFSLYNEAGELILKREGRTYLNRDPLVVVFEGRIDVGAEEPYRTEFEWLASPAWRKAPREYEVVFEEQELTKVYEGQELTVTAYNREAVALQNVEVVAIVYDKSQNAVASSQTYIDVIGPRVKKRITFAWPYMFSTEVGRIEFVPRIPRQD